MLTFCDLCRLSLYPSPEQNLAAHFGIFPYDLGVCLSQICHLAPASFPGERDVDAAQLDSAILAVDENDHDGTPLLSVSVWKLATRALLHQQVRGLGPLHPILKIVAADLVNAFRIGYPWTEAVPPVVNKLLAFPLFVTGALALQESERQLVLALWATLSPERGFAEPLALLQRVWAEMDETGDGVRWVSPPFTLIFSQRQRR